jgi:hypothetical protein
MQNTVTLRMMERTRADDVKAVRLIIAQLCRDNDTDAAVIALVQRVIEATAPMPTSRLSGSRNRPQLMVSGVKVDAPPLALVGKLINWIGKKVKK